MNCFFLKNEIVVGYFYDIQKKKLNIVFVVLAIGKTAFLFELIALYSRNIIQ